MHKVGLIVPSSNTTMEREFCGALRDVASVHAARVLLRTVDVSQLIALEDEAIKEAQKLSTAEVDIIIYGCTSGSFVKGSQQFMSIEENITNKTAKPCIATSGAVIRALTRLHAKKISLITPYIREITKIEENFLKANGFEPVSVFYASISDNVEIGKIKDEEVAEWTIKNIHPEADAVFISCTNLSTFNALQKVEEETNRPAISSNSATLWNTVEKLNLPVNLPHLGRLLTHASSQLIN